VDGSVAREWRYGQRRPLEDRSDTLYSTYLGGTGDDLGTWLCRRRPRAGYIAGQTDIAGLSLAHERRRQADGGGGVAQDFTPAAMPRGPKLSDRTAATAVSHLPRRQRSTTAPGPWRSIAVGNAYVEGAHALARLSDRTWMSARIRGGAAITGRMHFPTHGQDQRRRHEAPLRTYLAAPARPARMGIAVGSKGERLRHRVPRARADSPLLSAFQSRIGRQTEAPPYSWSEISGTGAR